MPVSSIGYLSVGSLVLVAALGSVCAVLLLKYRSANSTLDMMRSWAADQRKHLAERHKKRIEELKTEITKRETLIRKLKEQLRTLTEQQNPEEIRTRIIALSSEKEAYRQELSRVEQEATEEPDVSAESLGKLKDELSTANIENRKLQALMDEYRRRYEDILSWGNRMKKEQKQLLDRCEELERRLEEANRFILYRSPDSKGKDKT